MRAMILAAGLGTRLRPLTSTMPKPLLKINNKALIEYQIEALAKNNIKDIVINVHYLKEQVMNYLDDGNKYGVNISYSIEEELLNTGGGILKALPLLKEGPFLVVSADIYTLYPYKNLELPKDCLANLVFVANPNYNLKGDYALQDNGFVSVFGEKLTYANIGVFSPKLFSGFKVGNISLRKILQQAIVEQKVKGELYNGAWCNIGTSLELNNLQACLAIENKKERGS